MFSFISLVLVIIKCQVCFWEFYFPSDESFELQGIYNVQEQISHPFLFVDWRQETKQSVLFRQKKIELIVIKYTSDILKAFEYPTFLFRGY